MHVMLQVLPGEFESTVDILSPVGTDFKRIIIIGVGEENLALDQTWTKLGGAVMGAITKYQGKSVSVLPESNNKVRITPNLVAHFALGIQLRQYKFGQFKTKKSRRNKDDTSKFNRLENSHLSRKSKSSKKSICYTF